MQLSQYQRMGSRWEKWLHKHPENQLRPEAGNVHLNERLCHLNSKEFPIDKFYQWMTEENPSSNLTDKQKDNLQSVSDPSTVYIFTGQQPGLGGGPLLWFWKALTAVALADTLTKVSNRKHVPVFWIAGDDSDLNEVNRLTLLELDEPQTLSLRQPHVHSLVPVAERQLGDDVHRLLRQLSKYWNNDICRIFASFTSPIHTFSSHFKAIAQYALGETGILFLDGHSPRLRQLTAHMVHTIAAKASLFHTLLDEETERLRREGLSPQVQLQTGVVRLFSIANGIRERFRMGADGLKTDSGRKLLPGVSDDIWRTEADTISHDVVSRPLLIESIAPVVGHVLGPSEMGYFFQLRRVFEEFTGSRPLIHPRMMATIVGQTALNEFDRLDLPGKGIHQVSPSEMRRHISGQIWDNRIPHKNGLDAWDQTFQNLLKNELGDVWRKEAYEMMRPRLKVFLSQFESKTRNRLFEECKEDYKTIFSEINWCARSAPQDRHLSLFSVMHRFGMECISVLIKNVKPLEWAHQQISMPDSKNEICA